MAASRSASWAIGSEPFDQTNEQPQLMDARRPFASQNRTRATLDSKPSFLQMPKDTNYIPLWK